MTAALLAKHLAFAAAIAVFSGLIVRLMTRAGVMDLPDARKAHDRPVPKGGGVGVVAAFMAGMLVLYWREPMLVQETPLRALVIAAAAIAAVAFLDDVKSWSFRVKLGAQLVAATVAVAGGLVVDTLNLPLLGPVPLGWAGAPLTVCWILYATNAMNFIDGLNGLAAGSAALASAALAGIAAAQGGVFAYVAALLLAAGLIGFLPFNFPRARIFLGDVGSQFAGFLLAILAIAAGRFQNVELSILLVPMLLFGILYDVAFTLLRRLLAGEHVTQAHRSHLYQIAHRSGMPATTVTLVHWGFVLWGALCCALFLHGTGLARAALPLLVIPPQLAWTAYVAHRARSKDTPW